MLISEISDNLWKLHSRSTTGYMVKWMFAVRHQMTVLCWLKNGDCIQMRQDEGKGKITLVSYTKLVSPLCQR